MLKRQLPEVKSDCRPDWPKLAKSLHVAKMTAARATLQGRELSDPALVGWPNPDTEVMR